jgi:hypothetical protein
MTVKYSEIYKAVCRWLIDRKTINSRATRWHDMIRGTHRLHDTRHSQTLGRTSGISMLIIASISRESDSRWEALLASTKSICHQLTYEINVRRIKSIKSIDMPLEWKSTETTNRHQRWCLECEHRDDDCHTKHSFLSLVAGDCRLFEQQITCVDTINEPLHEGKPLNMTNHAHKYRISTV